MNTQPTHDACRHAVTQAQMWRKLALQCRALGDERTANEAESIARSYDRQSQRLAARHDDQAAA